MSYLRLIKRIEAFKNFEKGWDGDSAKSPSPKTTILAKQIANSLPQSETWFVTLTIDGTILFESDTGVIEVYCDDDIQKA